MSFLNTKTINPHLYLYALTYEPLKSQKETPLKTLNALAKTRRFDQLLNVAAQIKDISFPTLSHKIKLAKQQTEALKKELGQENVFQSIKIIDDLLKESDPNFEQIDLQQEKIFKLAQILYEEGNYKKSLDILVLLQKQEIKQQLWLKTTWARLYNEILLGKNSLPTLQALKKKIQDIQVQEIAFHNKEKKNNAAIMRKFYSQKEQFLLLSIFSLLKPGNATEENIQKFVEYCTSQKSYFSIVQLTFKEILRYLIVSIALNKTLHHNRAFDLFKLIEVINRKIINYQDSFTQYIGLVHIQYNFELAAVKLQECRRQIKNDIFLAQIEDKIIQGLQFLYFKLACKVYQTINLSEISKFTGKSSFEAELWILGYIRSGDIQAKIDSTNQLVINNRDRHHSSEKYIDVIPNLSTFVNSLSRAIANQ